MVATTTPSAFGCPHRERLAAKTASRVHTASPDESARLSLPPGPGGGRIRHLVSHFRAYPEFTKKMWREYGDVVLYRMRFIGDCCLVFDRDLIQGVLAAEEERIVRQQLSAAVSRLPNGGMQTRYGEEHRSRHSIVERAFAADRMHHHIDNMIDRVCERVDSWRAGQRIEVLDEMLRLCAGFYSDALLGRDMEADIELAMDLRSALKVEYMLEQLPIPQPFRKLPVPINKRVDRAFAGFDRLIDRAIERSRAVAKEERYDLVSCMIRHHDEYGDESPYSSSEIIRDEIYLVFLAALGPTAHLLTCGLERLARRPQVSRRLEAEADEVLSARRITSSDFDRLPYARATLREILRLRCAGWVVFKRAAVDLVIDDYLIPAGTVVHPCFGVLNTHPEHHEDGGEFMPERWLQESGPDSSRDDWYFPFSAGPRMCPGRELPVRLGALLLAAIAQRWVLKRASAKPSSIRYNPLGAVLSHRPVRERV
jgi:cytochrome P450